jgi:hypothetical protein
MTVTLLDEGSGRLAFEIVGVVSEVAAAQGAIANPFGVSVHILSAHLLVKTNAALAGTLGIGIAADATTGATDIWTTTAMNAKTEGSVYECFADPGAVTVLPTAVWTTDKFLTFSGATNSLAGFTGTLFLEIARTPAA